MLNYELYTGRNALVEVLFTRLNSTFNVVGPIEPFAHSLSHVTAALTLAVIKTFSPFVA